MKFIGILRDILQVNWIYTILYNLANLPFKQAKRLPILLYHPHFRLKDFIGRGGGIIISSEQCFFGMIKLGKQSQNTCIQNGIWISNRGTLIFKGSALVGNGCKIDIKKNAVLSIGENTGITGDTTINCHKKVILGDYFSCAWNVSITDTDFHECYSIDGDKKILKPVEKEVIIGNYVWLCQNVTILKGVCLSDWITIGTNALVNRSIIADKYSLAVGIPAKPTSTRIQRSDLAKLKCQPNFHITKGLGTFG